MSKKPVAIILEDEEVLLDILLQKLSSVGFDVRTATDGETGLGLIRRVRPRIVLLDLAMPKMNGVEVLRSMHADPNLSKIPVLIISNSGENVEVKELLKLGASDYLVKADFTPDEVLVKVEKCLKKTSVTPPTRSALSPDPAMGPAPSPVKTHQPSSIDKTQAPLIMLIEDDPFLGEIAYKKLEKEGFRVELVDRGEKAVSAIQRSRPDLVLLDVMLPDIDGFQVMEQLRAGSRALFDQTPVIFLSNFGQEENRDRALSLGARDYLVKANFTTDEILDRIKKELNP